MSILDLTKTKVLIEPSECPELSSDKDYPVNYVVLDFETTGLDPQKDDIIQLAAFRYRNHEKVSEFVSYVYTPRVPPKITKLTSITTEQCHESPRLQWLLPQLVDFIGGDVLVAHNAKFDLSFLTVKMQQYEIPGKVFHYVDTLALARKKIKGVANYKLTTLKKYLKLEGQSHLADEDCLICYELYKYCCGITSITERPANRAPKTKTLKQSNAKQFQEKIEQALALEGNGSLDEAMALYEDCVSLNCDDTRPYDRLILLYRKKRQKPDEIRILVKAIEQFKEIDKYYIRLNKID